MPYDEGQKAETRVPRLQQVFQRIEKLNAQQRDIIDQLEGRAHSLLNKRVPDDPEKKVADMNPNPNDAVSGLMSQLDRMETNTITLQRLLNHLQEIV